MIGRRVQIYITKYDGSLRWKIQAWFIMQKGSLIVTQTLVSEYGDRRSRHWSIGSDFQTYFWEDRWYNVVRWAQPVGDNVLWYCNIATPALFDGTNLHYVDLDLDVVVRADRTIEVQDEEEFQDNVIRYRYPEDVIREARRAVSELSGLVQRCEFPFQAEDRSLQ